MLRARPRRRFNRCIGIDEIKAEPRSQATANRCFARTHNANQHDGATLEAAYKAGGTRIAPLGRGVLGVGVSLRRRGHGPS
jgi:hypothetical protein